uniref:Membrane-spanning 4-domains subfamily A member 15-like n=1 Tax=Stegastes partitus TaxID=144197 RepID=A0A3B5A712_9TELE
MEVSSSTATGGIFVITHVIPAAPTAASQNRPEKVQFSGGRPQALGTVQILIGLVVLFFGLIQLPYSHALEIYSGVFVWAALTFITAGSVTVAAGRLSSRRLVKAALGLSAAAAVISAAATIIYCMNAIISHSGVYYREPINCCWFNGSYYSCCYDWESYYIDWVPAVGVSCVLAVFSFLVLIVSVRIAMFGYRALSHSTNQPPVIMINQLLEAASQTPKPMPTYEASPTPTYEVPPAPEAPPPSEDNYEVCYDGRRSRD